MQVFVEPMGCRGLLRGQTVSAVFSSLELTTEVSYLSGPFF